MYLEIAFLQISAFKLNSMSFLSSHSLSLSLSLISFHDIYIHGLVLFCNFAGTATICRRASTIASVEKNQVFLQLCNMDRGTGTGHSPNWHPAWLTRASSRREKETRQIGWACNKYKPSCRSSVRKHPADPAAVNNSVAIANKSGSSLSSAHSWKDPIVLRNLLNVSSSRSAKADFSPISPTTISPTFPSSILLLFVQDTEIQTRILQQPSLQLFAP